MRFQAGQAYLERASEQLDQKLANPSATGFGKFVVPNFTIAGSTLKSKEERSCPVHQSMRLSDSRIESSSTGHGAKKGVGKSWEGSTKDEEQLNLTVPTSTQRVIRVTPSSMGFSSDGSIGPISKLLLTDPVDFLVDIGRNVLEKILPQELHRERALILTSNSDHNGAFNLSVFTNIRRTFNFRQIERNYKVTYKKVSDVSSLCRAIDEVTEAQGPVHLLIIRAHGTKRTITLDENNSLKVGDPLPNDSCFRRLPPKATVVVEGCSTGKGKEMADNLANYIAQYMDDSIRIFSPTEDVNHMHLSNNHPIEVRFIHLMARDRDATYTIDERNRGSIQERRSIITKIPSEYEDGYESLLDDIEADLDAF